ncbi:MAG TPA: hypothetical protein VGF49_17465, partial [Candidatus Solibacter sp.]
MVRRRDFLAKALASAPLLGAMGRRLDGAPSPTAAILARIRPPRFPDRAFDVMAYGATADGKTDCRAAFTQAIAECHKSGGKVEVP